jgi:dTDP-6-deoxy-L-talose 4-dehydrogenase (NAD+)
MTLLITGSTGFVGSELAKLLASRGDVFHVLNRSGIFRNGQKIRDCSFDLASFQIPTPEDLIGYTKLVHLAWNGLPNYKSELHLAQVNAHKQLLLSAVDAGIEAIFSAGTCLEYGLTEGALTTSSVAQPTTTYGQAKLQLLNFLKSLHQERTFKYTWGRFFYLYGQNQNTDSLYPSILKALENSNNVQLRSSGMQVRDFISIENAVLAIMNVLDQGCNLEIVNIGSGNPIRVKDWAQKHIPAESSSKVEVSHKLWPEYEPSCAWASDSFMT